MAGKKSSNDNVILGLALLLSVEAMPLTVNSIKTDKFTYEVGITKKQLEEIKRRSNPEISSKVEMIYKRIKASSGQQFDNSDPLANIKEVLSKKKYSSALEELGRDRSWIDLYSNRIYFGFIQGNSISPQIGVTPPFDISTSVQETVFDLKPVEKLEETVTSKLTFNFNIKAGSTNVNWFAKKSPKTDEQVASITVNKKENQSDIDDKILSQFNKLKEFEAEIIQVKKKVLLSRAEAGQSNNALDNITEIGQNKPMSPNDSHSSSLETGKKAVTQYSKDMTFDEFQELLAYDLEQTKSKKHIREDLTEREISSQYHLFSMALDPTFIERKINEFDQVVLDQLHELSKPKQTEYVANVKKKYLDLLAQKLP